MQGKIRQGEQLEIDEKTTLADCIAHFIADKNTPAVFQLSGGMIAFIIDAIGRLGKTPIVNTRHEQAAGFAAEGSARVTGIPGFAFGTSGPGATNLLTPIASSFFDSIPVVYITGQVDQNELRKSPLQRQSGFQELDICEIARSVTKKVYKPQNAHGVFAALEEGWALTLEGRQGPVLIDIPINLQQEAITYLPSVVTPKHEISEISIGEKTAFLELLNKASQPLILVGGGVRLSNASKLLSEFIEKTGIPYVSTLLGLDAASQIEGKYLGFIGSYGNRWANSALEKSDLLIVLGSRLDVRQTGNNIARFTAKKKIIRVDIDQHELNGRISSDLIIRSNIKDFLLQISGIDYRIKSEEFIKEIKNLKFSHPQPSEQKSKLSLNPNEVMEWLSKLELNIYGYAIDVGQHQMWAAQSLTLSHSQRFLTSGGLGAMGFAIPAAIGAAFATKSKWISISGDGCLQLSSAELQTITQYNLSIAVCVMNNGQHGMVAQFQDENMNGRLTGTREGFSNPDFQDLARAYGFSSIYKVSDTTEMKELSIHLEAWEVGPVFIEFIVDPRAKALPKMSVKG